MATAAVSPKLFVCITPPVSGIASATASAAHQLVRIRKAGEIVVALHVVVDVKIMSSEQWPVVGIEVDRVPLFTGLESEQQRRATVLSHQREQPRIFAILLNILPAAAEPGRLGVAAKHVAVAAADQRHRRPCVVTLAVERAGVESVSAATVQQRQPL